MTERKDRFASIEGILAKDRKVATATPIDRAATLQAVPQPDDEKQTAPPSTQPTKRAQTPTRTRTTSPASSQAGGTRRVGYKLDPELKTKLATRAARDKRSQVDVVKSAIEAAETGGKFKGAFSTDAKSGMFTRTHRATATAKVSCDLLVTTPDRDLIDKLVKQHGAKDRTALIVKALELYL